LLAGENQKAGLDRAKLTERNLLFVTLLRVRKLSLAFVLSLLPFAAQADISDVFRQFDHGTSADKDFVKALILGIEDGFEAANDELKANGKPMLYCAPEAMKFTGDQLVEILRRRVSANRVKAPRLEAAPPATALLYALEDAFPCR